MIAMPFLPLSWRGPLLIAMVIILSLGTFGYSYFLYLEEKKNGKINN